MFLMQYTWLPNKVSENHIIDVYLDIILESLANTHGKKNSKITYC